MDSTRDKEGSEGATSFSWDDVTVCWYDIVDGWTGSSSIRVALLRIVLSLFSSSVPDDDASLYRRGESRTNCQIWQRDVQQSLRVEKTGPITANRASIYSKAAWLKGEAPQDLIWWYLSIWQYVSVQASRSFTKHIYRPTCGIRCKEDNVHPRMGFVHYLTIHIVN